MLSRKLLSVFCVFVGLLAASMDAAAQDLSKKQIAKMLRRMYKTDQAARVEYIKFESNNNPADSIALKAAGRKLFLADSIHYISLQIIFKAVGYPDIKESGGNGPSYFWLLVQHQDHHPAFQDSVLTLMKPVVDSGEVSGILYAMLLDRVRLNTGKQQVYGTQVQLNADSSAYEMRPCDDPAHVNERRESVGLGPIEVYLESFNKDLKKPEQSQGK